MLISNWHTHTQRCGHARGTDEEYVQAAIAAGVKTLGFSDHAPYPGLPGLDHRMEYEEYPEYVASIKELKEKYQDQIAIHIGLEIEYIEDYLDTLQEYRRDMDYLLLGQHCFDRNDADDSYLITEREGLVRYCDLLEKACAAGLADCIVHPDVCLWSYPRIDEAVIEAAERIADISVRYDVPLEINCGSGVKRGKTAYDDGERYPYPVREFFAAFARKGCRTLVGLDIHDPRLFATDLYIDRALEVCEGLDLQIDPDYDMIGNARRRKESHGFI